MKSSLERPNVRFYFGDSRYAPLETLSRRDSAQASAVSKNPLEFGRVKHYLLLKINNNL
jgi:hypothetical protein